MRRRQLLFPFVTTLALGVGLFAGPASADPPATLFGTYVQVPTTGQAEVIRAEGKATHIRLSIETVHSGALTGSSLDTFTCILVEGREKFHCHGGGTFTGTVMGISGSGTMRSHYSGTCHVATTVCEGRSQFHGVDGALERVHGTSTPRDAGNFPARAGSAEVQLHRH